MIKNFEDYFSIEYTCKKCESKIIETTEPIKNIIQWKCIHCNQIFTMNLENEILSNKN